MESAKLLFVFFTRLEPCSRLGRQVTSSVLNLLPLTSFICF